MSRLTDLRRLTPLQRCYVLAYRRAYVRAGIEFREELALLSDAHRQEMAKLARFYDEQLATLAADFAALAREHRERRAVAQAQAERALDPFRLLH